MNKVSCKKAMSPHQWTIVKIDGNRRQLRFHEPTDSHLATNKTRNVFKDGKTRFNSGRSHQGFEEEITLWTMFDGNIYVIASGKYYRILGRNSHSQQFRTLESVRMQLLPISYVDV